MKILVLAGQNIKRAAKHFISEKILLLLFLFVLKFPLYSALSDSSKVARRWKNWIGNFEFHSHDRIVSLGCGNAWREFELLALTDSLDFYLEDIDSSQLKASRILQNIEELSKGRKRPPGHTYRIIYGDTNHIPLQKEFADKVIIMNAWHHFGNKENMLKEIYRILKSHGRLIITDHIALKESKYSSYGCDRTYFLLNENDFISMAQKAGFKLLRSEKMARRTRQFVLEKMN